MCTHCALRWLSSTIFEPPPCTLRWLWQNFCEVAIGRLKHSNKPAAIIQSTIYLTSAPCFRQGFNVTWNIQWRTIDYTFTAHCFFPRVQRTSYYFDVNVTCKILSFSIQANIKRDSSVYSWIDQWILCVFIRLHGTSQSIHQSVRHGSIFWLNWNT